MCSEHGITYSYIEQTQLCGEVERGVAIVRKIGILEAFGVVLDDAFEEAQVLEVDRPANASRNVNPVGCEQAEQAEMEEVRIMDLHIGNSTRALRNCVPC